MEFAGDVIEDSAAGEGHVGIDAASVRRSQFAISPRSCRGIPKPTMRMLGHLLDHGLVFRAAGGFIEVAVVGADDAQVGEAGLELGNGFVRQIGAYIALSISTSCRWDSASRGG